MKKIVIGKFDESLNYDFRETCFGLLVRNEKVLLAIEPNGEHSLIGGGIENIETHEECLIREYQEEAGLVIDVNDYLYIIDCYWITKHNTPMHSLTHIYLVSMIDECEMTENFDSEYVDINDAIALLPLPYQKKALELFLDI